MAEHICGVSTVLKDHTTSQKEMSGIDHESNYDKYYVCFLIGQSKKAEECVIRYVQGQSLCKDVNYSLTGGDELSNGRAGYIFGMLWLRKYFSDSEIKLYLLSTLLHAMLTAGRGFFMTTKHVSSIFYSGSITNLIDSPIMYSYFNIKYLGNFKY